MKKNFKRILALLLVFVMACTNVMPVLAETLPDPSYDATLTVDSGEDAALPDGEAPILEEGGESDGTAVVDTGPMVEVTGDESEESDLPDETVEPPVGETQDNDVADPQPDETPENALPEDEDSEEPEELDEPSKDEQDDDLVAEDEEPAEEAEPFVKLEIADASTVIDAEIGEQVEFFVKLSRDDVNVLYQWQKYVTETDNDEFGTSDGEDPAAGEDELVVEEFESFGYFFPVEDATESDILAFNPEATWPGKWLWEEAVELANGDASKVHVPAGAKTIEDVVIDGISEGSGLGESAGDGDDDDGEFSSFDVWMDIEGETGASYLHTASAGDANTKYRCVVTIDDNQYFIDAATSIKLENAEDDAEEAESNMVQAVVIMGDVAMYDGIPVNARIISEEMECSVPEEVVAEEQIADVMSRMRVSAFSVSNSLVTLNVYLDAQTPSLIHGADGNVEYITEDAFLSHLNDGVENANSQWWTKVAGNNGSRPGAQYSPVPGWDSNANTMPILSAWYGKTVYFRNVGDGKDSWIELDIPAYTGVQYPAGTPSLYKDAVSTLTIKVDEEANDFYLQYANFVANSSSGEVGDGDVNESIRRSGREYIFSISTTIHRFNENPDFYLKDAEGNYKVDSVILGACTGSTQPDISGKAAWALRDYLAEGYGFMTGHDMLYYYAGVGHVAADVPGNKNGSPGNYWNGQYDPATGVYTPDKNSGVTYHWHNGKGYAEPGSFNLAWLLGSLKDYTQTSPYSAPSLILSTGGSPWDKNMYGDGYDNDSSINGSQTKIVLRNKLLNPGSIHANRVPTNYPYTLSDDELILRATHTNNQISFGSIWADFKQNSLAEFIPDNSHAVIETVDGIRGTNNFYLSTNGNIAMNQIGHHSLSKNAMVTFSELAFYANTLMYISQRQQCQVCQSEQGDNHEIHFVHRIYSAEELQKLNDPNLWFTYPTRNCYMLGDDIELPADWEPIRNFDGHFNADGHEITFNENLPAEKRMVFDNTSGTMDQYANGVDTGWNIGTDSTKGLNKVSDVNGNRTTGIARVSGYIRALFEGAGYDMPDNLIGGGHVVVDGTDGKTYESRLNADGKYVISNLPCTGIMTAHVYDVNGREITEYGPIRVNVPNATSAEKKGRSDFWNTAMTTELYLGGFVVSPVENEAVYESGKVIFSTQASSVSTTAPTVEWQYRKPGGAWTNVPASMGTVDSTSEKVTASDYVTTTTLTIKSADPAWNDYEFRAVFTAAGLGSCSSYNYFLTKNVASLTAGDREITVAYGDKLGKLTVKTWPGYTTQGPNQTTYVGAWTDFTSTGYALDDGTSIKAEWEYSTDAFSSITGEYLEWHKVSGSSEFGSQTTVTTGTPTLEYKAEILAELKKLNADSDAETFKANAKFHSVTTTLHVDRADLQQRGTHFRVHYTATSSHGTVIEWYSDIADNKVGTWTTQSGTFGDSKLATKKDNANVLNVIPPELQIVSTKAAQIKNDSGNLLGSGGDNMTVPVDEYGQVLHLASPTETIAEGTAYYEAVIYYLPTGYDDRFVPDVEWQFLTYLDRNPQFFAKAGSVGTEANKYPGLQVEVQNTPLGEQTSGAYKGYYAIRSRLILSNVPHAMYNTETMLKYFFRCKATQTYTSSKGTYETTRTGTLGGLSIGYSIELQHNGVLRYDGVNNINGTVADTASAIAAATKNQASSTWAYPNLTIKIPSDRHINSVVVYIKDSPAHSANDQILLNKTAIDGLGVKVVQANSDAIVLVSKTNNTVEKATWELILRNYVTFLTFDSANFSEANIKNQTTGGESIRWIIDENRLEGALFDPESGKAFRLVTSSEILTWEDAANAAQNSPANSVFTNGRLAQPTTQSQLNLVKQVANGNAVWLGGLEKLADGSTAWSGTTHPAGGTWKWSTANSNITQWTFDGTEGPYLSMQADGSLKGLAPAYNTIGTHTLTNRGSGARIIASNGVAHQFSFNVVQGHKYYVETASGAYGDSNSSASIKCDAFGIPYTLNNANSNYDDWYTAVSGIYTAQSNTATFVYKVEQTGTDVTGFYAMTRYINIFDLTEAFGEGNEPDMNGIREMIDATDVAASGGITLTPPYPTLAPIGQYLATWTITFGTQHVTDVKAYVAEYDIDSLGLDITNHTASDETFIGTNVPDTSVPGEKVITVSISGNTKVYDGTQIAPSNFTAVAGTKNANLSLLQITYSAPVSGNQSGYTTRTVNGANWQTTNAVNATRYHAVVSLTQAAKDAGYSLSSDSTTECDLIISQRPVDVKSLNNNKVYDGSEIGAIKNFQITGVLTGDTVKLNQTSVLGTYLDANGNTTTHNSNGVQLTMQRLSSSTLSIKHDATSDPHCNYTLGTETYTGAISARPLYVHSTYQDKETYTYTYANAVGTKHTSSIIRYTSENQVDPNNVKKYDNTTSAVISNIAIDNIIEGDKVWVDKESYIGTYATNAAGETLTSDGRAQSNRYNKLTETTITRTEAMSLVNNAFGDYYIASETYSGAIYRASLEIGTSDTNYVYGDNPNFTLSYLNKYTATEAGGKSEDGYTCLYISPLLGSDELVIRPNVTKISTTTTIDSKTPVGDYPITVSGMTEANYPVLKNYIVVPRNGSISVTPRELTVSVAGGYEKLYGDPMPKFDFDVTGFVNGDTIANTLAGTAKFGTLCTRTSDVRRLSIDGTIIPYTVTISGLSVQLNKNGYENYTLNYVPGDITVLPRPVTIRAIDEEKVYGFADPNLDYTMDTSRVKQSDLQFDLSRIRGEDVGQYDIFFDETKITELDRSNYDITFIPAKMSITPRMLIIEALDYERYYGEENPAFEVSYNGLAMGDTVETVLEGTLEYNCSATRLSPIGGYNISISGETVKTNSQGNQNYYIVYTDGSLLIKPLPITIIAEDKIKYVGEPDPELTWYLADGQTVVDPVGAPLNVTLMRKPGEEPFGTYAICSDPVAIEEDHDIDCACELQRLNPNYIITYEPGFLTILDDTDDDTLVLKVGDASMIYGEAEPVGDYRLIWYMNEDGKQDIPEGTDVRDFFDLKLAGTLTFDVDGTDPRDVGVYDINGSGLISGQYDNVIIIPGNLNVKPRPVTITPHDKTKTYGDPDPELTYSIYDEITKTFYEDGSDPAARVKEGDLSAALSRNQGEDVGRYLIRVGMLGEDPNYVITLDRAFLEIQPADLYVAVWNFDDPQGVFHRTFGQPNPDFDYDIDGFKNGDDESCLTGTIKYQTTAEMASSVGEYPINASGFSAKNYDIHYVPGVLEITPLDITVIIDNATKVYGNPDPETFSWHVPETDVAIENSAVKGTPTRAPGRDVGGYAITGTFTSDDPNIGNITVIPGIFTITPAKLVVRAQNKTKVYGDENPEWTSVASNLKYDDKLEDMDGEIVYSVKENDGVTDVSRTTDVGKYPIIISESSTLSSKNYEISYEDAVLTITKRPIDITPGDPDKPDRSMSVVKNADRSVVMVGETINYSLVVTNTGRYGMENVEVVDTNSGAGRISAKNGHGYTYEGNSKFLIPTLPAGQSVTITYSYVATLDDAGKSVINSAVAKVPGIPENPGDPDDPDNPPTPELPPLEVPSNEVIVRVEPVRDVAIVKMADKESVSVGETITYTLRVTNRGAKAVTDVRVYDEMSARNAASVVESTSYTFENGVFTIPRLAAGASLDLVYTYVAQEEDAGSILHNVAVVTIPNIPENPVRGMEIVKVADKDRVNVGETIHYTLTVTNTGNVMLENIPVVDNNNGAGEITAKDGMGYSYDGDSTFTIFRLPVGASIDIEYDYVAVEEDAGKVVKNVAVGTVPGDPDDPDPNPPVPPTVPSNEVEVPVNPKKDLTIVKSSDKVEAEVGDTIRYTLTVNNTGTADLKNVTVTDANDGAGRTGFINAAIDFSYVDENGDAQSVAANVSADKQTITIPVLPAGAGGTISYDYVVVDEDAGKVISNLAVAKIPVDPEDPTEPPVEIPSNPVDIPVGEVRSVSIVKSADKAFVTVGETIHYTLDVTNTGSVDLTALRVKDTNSGAGSIVAVSGNGYTYVGDSEFIIASLAVGETVNIHYTYTTVKADNETVVINSAVVTVPGEPAKPGDPPTPAKPEIKVPSNEVKIPVEDPGEEIPSNPVDVPVRDVRSIAIVKSADKAFVNVGETVTYTLDVTNNGSIDLTNVTVKDNSNASGLFEPEDGDNYRVVNNNEFSIPYLPVGETVSIVYSYVAQEKDAGKTLVNIAVATVPGEPGEPGDPDDPSKPPVPPTPSIEIPSNEIDIPVRDPKTPITIIADPYIKVYGDADPTLTYKFGEPLVKPTDVWGNVERDPGEEVGVYPINQGTVSSDNYEINFIPSTFTIVPAPLTITALDETRMIGEKNPAFRVTYEGFKFNDGPQDLDGTLSVTTTATETSPVGKYPIVPAGLSSKNYDIKYVNGTLTVYDTSKLLIEKTADKTSVKPGDVVTYTVKVSNLGSRAYQNLLVTDTLQAAGTITASNGKGYKYLGDGKFEIASLKRNETIIIIYTYTVQEEDLGTVLRNTVTVTDPKDPDPNPPGDETKVKVPDGSRSLTIVKSANVDTAKVGDIVEYQLLVTNTGEMDMTNVVVNDTTSGKGAFIAKEGVGYTNNGNSTFTIASLRSGETVAIRYDYVVADADESTTIVNVAVAHIPDIPANPGDPDDPDDPGTPEIPGEDVPSNEVEVEVGDAKRNVTITKSADVETVTVGETINYTITVRNTGEITLENFTVHDDFNGYGTPDVKSGNGYTYDGNMNFTIHSLAVGESIDLTYSYVTVEEDADTVIHNVAIACIPEKPGKPHEDMKIVKYADKERAMVGDTIHYSLVVTNTGNVDLKNVPVVDNNDGAGTITAQNGHGYTYEGNSTFVIASLPAGESVTITYEYLVVEADAGKVIKNVAVGTIPYELEDPDDPDPNPPEPPTVPSNEIDIPVDPTRDVLIVKSADKEMAKVGDVITYTITVKNTGESDLTDLIVEDGMENAAGEIDLIEGDFTIPFLAVGESAVIRYTYTVQEEDAGKTLINVAVVKIPGDPDDPTEPPPPVPSNEIDVPVADVRDMSIVKRADKAFVNVGETITYTLDVTNTGSEDLHDVIVRDTNNGAGEIEAQSGSGYTYLGNSEFQIASLRVGETVSITYTYTALKADGNNVVVNSAVGIVPEVPGKPGDPDDPTNPPEPPKPPLEIPSNEVEVPVKDPDEPPTTTIPSDPVDIPVINLRRLTVVKSADVDNAMAGDVVTYSLAVTNTGTVELKDFTVQDETSGKGEFDFHDGDGYTYLGDATFKVTKALGVGETIVITYQYTVAKEDENTVVRNIAVAKIPGVPGVPPDPEHPDIPTIPPYPPVEIPSNPVDIPVGEYVRGVSIVKTSDKQTATLGDIITYTLTVKNTGNVPLSDVLVQDNLVGHGTVEAKAGKGYTYDGDMTFTISSLAVGETVDITYYYTVVEEDLNTVVHNVAVVTIPGDPDDPTEPPPPVPSNEIDIPVLPVRDLTIVKSANVKDAKPGDLVTYTLTVKNTGNVTLSNVIVKDVSSGTGMFHFSSGIGYEFIGNMSFKLPLLNVGETIVITYTYTVGTGDAGKTVHNVAVATIPGKPAKPGDPDDPTNPPVPELPPVEIPSNPVDVNVAGKPPVIVTNNPNPTTGVGFFAGAFVLLAALAACVTAFFMLFKTRKKDDEDSTQDE